MGFMFFMLFGSGLWFLYDGFVAWPREQTRYEVFLPMAEAMVAAGDARDIEDPLVENAWQKLAQERGWKKKIPKERTPGSIGGQRITGWVLLAGSLVFAGWVAWNHRLSVRADGDIVTGVNGEQVHLDSIVEMDRSKWKSKGIAYAVYEKDGKRLRLTLDDHKFLGCEQIILEAERRIAERAKSA